LFPNGPNKKQLGHVRNKVNGQIYQFYNINYIVHHYLFFYSKSPNHANTDSCCQDLAASGPFDWVEFFAGEAQATHQMKHYGGHRTAKLDIMYMSLKDGIPNTNPMDINSDSGMANLGNSINFFFYAIYVN